MLVLDAVLELIRTAPGKLAPLWAAWPSCWPAALHVRVVTGADATRRCHTPGDGCMLHASVTRSCSADCAEDLQFKPNLFRRMLSRF